MIALSHFFSFGWLVNDNLVFFFFCLLKFVYLRRIVPCFLFIFYPFDVLSMFGSSKCDAKEKGR